MTDRERILAVLNHKEPDRIPIHDSIWGATINRWKKEGLPEDVDVAEYFNFEFRWMGADTSPRFPTQVFERNEKYILTTTSFGGKRKNWTDYSTTPELVECPIKTKQDWSEIKKRLKPDFTRVDWASGLSNFQKYYGEGKFICYSGGFGYDILQNYMRSDQLLLAMIEDPEWIKDMVMTLAELNIVMCELMLKNGFKFDGAWMWNDMGYRNGLLFSPDLYYKTHYQADKMAYSYFHSKGLKTFLHSCGNVKELIPIMIETGLDCLQPLEVKAGMDVVELKEKFGDKISFMGGIDVRVMEKGDKEKIEEEIKRKIVAAKKNGGYIYHSDHSVPKDVSFETYKYVIETVKKYGEYEKKEEPVQEKVLVETKPEEKKEDKKESKSKFSFKMPTFKKEKNEKSNRT